MSDAESQLDGFIAKFDPENQTLIRECRAALRKRLPTANELIYDNYNFFVIGYCSSERASDCIVSIAAGANGVSLSFYNGAALADPAGILQGSGNQNRFIRLPSATILSRRDVDSLIGEAAKNGKVALSETGSGKLIIKSISAKQRPRRKG